MQSIIVAMERERWLPAGARPTATLLVNLPDFSAKVYGQRQSSLSKPAPWWAPTYQMTAAAPEFSDVMEFMVINPSWYVPRSIVTKEYLPQLQQNPNAVGHIEITDSRGRRINREATDFSQFTARSFPFAMRQPPSPKAMRCGLGQVHVPQPLQHLSARHPRQEPVRARGTGLFPRLRPAGRPV